METPADALLIIFYRNPEYGSVKTRLAATIGDTKAMCVFKGLAEHTKNITQGLLVDKVAFYSDHVEHDDLWTKAVNQKNVQHGADLGKRMNNAFTWGFENGYKRVCVIGTDCLELTTDILTKAFESLLSADVVIGPARDGGYYLLGMTGPHREFFRNKRWSTKTVYADTMNDIKTMAMTCTTLGTLSDIDTESDLPTDWQQRFHCVGK